MEQLKDVLEEISNHNTLLFKNSRLQKWVEEGYVIAPNKVIRDKNISATALRLYLLLLSRLFQKNFCFPGRELLATELSLSARQVDRYILELKKAKYVEVKRRGQGKTNVYCIEAD